MPDDSVRHGSSPYSTGGGGVVLEHQYAASALAAVLLAEPVAGLGSGFVARRVGLQQERYSPVDDVMVLGSSGTDERTLRVACRRHPTIGRSDESTVKLFADYLIALLDERSDLEQGVLRLGLAVAGPFGPATELGTLADVARRQPDRATLAEAVHAPGAYSGSVRRRLDNVDEIVEEALKLVGGAASREDPQDLAWELLRSLYVIQTQFEGDAAPGITEVVAGLQSLAGGANEADHLRAKLVEIASQGALRAGLYDRTMLRRDLAGFQLGPSKDYASAKQQVEALEAELRAQTQDALPVSGDRSDFALARAQLRSNLKTAISSLPPGGVLLVHGEPGVGKSALALGVADSIRGSGGAVLALSLRDIPSKVVDFPATIGLTARDLMASAPSSEPNVVLLDGGEALQETPSTAARPLLEVARSTGRRIVLVARDDSLGAVRELVSAAGVTDPVEFAVPPLTDGEIAEVVGVAPQLERLAADHRSTWLLGRLGLIELLLQSAEAGTELPGSLSSEADVFRVVWSSLVRNEEKRDRSVSPDDREAAALDVADHLLSGRPQISTGLAFAALRSDGILLPKGPTAAWQRGDAFASDLIRDFAVARLLISKGLGVLASSEGPRWAVRASRVYAQARIAAELSNGKGAVAAGWEELEMEFRALAAEHGARWREVPWEGLLTAGWVESVLDSWVPPLTERPGALEEAVRCVDLRFSEAGACDPFIAAPLVERIIETQAIRGARVYGGEKLVEFVASWLRGMARREMGGANVAHLRPLRGRVREALLTRAPERGERERLEGLALLGADGTSDTRDLLQHMAATAPAFLAPVVESLDASMSLANHDVRLLAELTEAYYIEEPTEQYYGSGLMDDGIRRHQGVSGMFTPLAAWYRGPFLFLLRSDFQLGLRVIDRMLARGARVGVRVLEELTRGHSEDRSSSQRDSGLLLDLFGYGRREYAGDAHVWSWYRGSSVGPYPCMSALFSLEMVLDEFAKAGVPLRSIVLGVLRNATTLATPGLAYGFLVRHIAHVTDELDDFLAVPEVWELEFGRTMSEGRLHVQGADSPEMVGRERRGWTPREVASQLVLEARRKGDATSLERLRGIGRMLIERAGGEAAPPQVRQWAAHLDWESYEVTAEPDRLIIEVRPPKDVVEALAPAQTQSEKVLQLYGLQNRYRPEQVTPYRYSVAPLPGDGGFKADVALARKLEREVPTQPLDQVRMSVAGVAATLVVNGKHEVEKQDLCWAVSVLIDSGLRPYADDFPSESSIFPDGADRKAALALPHALILTQPCERIATQEISAAITSGMTSFFCEVRANAAEASRQVFRSACRPASDGRCWHEPVWEAVVAGARSVRLGRTYEEGRRQMEPITGNLLRGLELTETADLMLTHVAPAAVAAIAATGELSCVPEEAVPMRDVLVHTYARTSCHWAEENYHIRPEQEGAFASAVVQWALEEGSAVLTRVARLFATSPHALGDFLHALTLVATYEHPATPLLEEEWPELMDLGLDTLRGEGVRNDWGQENLIRNLIPDPTALAHVGNFDQVLDDARSNWLTLNAVSPHIEDWVELGKGDMSCVDALVSFLEAQPTTDQIDPGLSWIRTLVVEEGGKAATSGFLLIPWLSELRSNPMVRGEALANYRAIVDGLAIAGYAEARALQAKDE